MSNNQSAGPAPAPAPPKPDMAKIAKRMLKLVNSEIRLYGGIFDHTGYIHQPSRIVVMAAAVEYGKSYKLKPKDVAAVYNEVKGKFGYKLLP
jgi:hypothetical protein